MGRVKVLDQNMINMIAAGEVIERPASVVKELLENSIDSDATSITITIEDGGRKLISVNDDGYGMDVEDMLLAFKPHATSKIASVDDLHNISTLGFRGEALASIASVSQVKAISRTRDSASANCLEIDCGQEMKNAPCSADFGTTINVRDLFYKLPARRKFLRTANTEMSHISETFTRLALANQKLNLELIHNGRQLYRLAANEPIRSRIAELFSAEISENLLDAQINERDINIYALIGRPEISRANNKFQYIFLNGRFIQDKFISHAIREAYRGSLEQNRFPVVFLFIQMPNDSFDVNVHPTKAEVRFYNSNLVHSQVLACLREKLLSTNLDVSASISDVHISGGRQNKPGNQRSQQITDAMSEFFKKHRPEHNQPKLSFDRPHKSIPAQTFISKSVNSERTDNIEHQQVGKLQSLFMQIHDSFIIQSTDEGFVIIDQHALHERIMYENLCDKIRESNLTSQRLLIPETLTVTDIQANAINENRELFEKLGIDIVSFGPRTMAIQAFPLLLANVSAFDFVTDLIDFLLSGDCPSDSAALLDTVLDMAACKAAIKAGQKLTNEEIEKLLEQKDLVDRSSRCAHGRPTTIKFTLQQLQKQFKRT